MYIYIYIYIYIYACVCVSGGFGSSYFSLFENLRDWKLNIAKRIGNWSESSLTSGRTTSISGPATSGRNQGFEIMQILLVKQNSKVQSFADEKRSWTKVKSTLKYNQLSNRLSDFQISGFQIWLSNMKNAGTVIQFSFSYLDVQINFSKCEATLRLERAIGIPCQIFIITTYNKQTMCDK